MPKIAKRILGVPAKTDWPVPSLHGTRWEASDGNTYATIIGNPDGTPFTVGGVSRYIAVVDAKYRWPGLPWNLYNKPLDSMSYCWDYGTSGNITVDMSEAELNALSFVKNEEHTSQFNTSVMVANAATVDVFGNVGSPQANYCNSLSLASGLSYAFQVPSGPVLARIWQQRTLIDSLDPTAASFPAYSLANWGFGETPGRVFASSQYNAGYAVTIRYDGLIFYNLKYEGVNGCLPVLEIEA